MNYFTINPKEGYGYIYKYTSPSGKNYIGQTKYSLEKRSQKNGIGYKKCRAFYTAIQKYGFENFRWEILEECVLEDLDKKEAYYISLYNSVVPNGYNIYPSGSGILQNKYKKAVDVYNLRGEYITTFNSLTQASEYYKIPWQAISACVRQEIKYYKDKIYVYHGVTPDKAEKIYFTNGRRTAQYDLEGNLINIYPSANAAAKALKKNKNAGRNIRSAAEGKRKTAFGYKWIYLE